MNAFQAIVLGLIQGITEFLPISSSAHLVIIPEVFGWQQQSLTFDIVAHAGSLSAILYYYRLRIKTLTAGLIGKIRQPGKKDEQISKADKRLLLNIVIATIPTILIYLLARRYIENVFESINVIKYSLLIGGVLLILSDVYSKKIDKYLEINSKIAFLVGIGQGISLIRGVSRSGIMLTIGLFSRAKRKETLEFLFLASIPVIFSGLILELVQYVKDPTNEGILLLLLGFLTSALSGYFAITLLNKFINRNILIYSGIYRIFIALLLIFI